MFIVKLMKTESTMLLVTFKRKADAFMAKADA